MMLVWALALGCGLALEVPVEIALGQTFRLEPGRATAPRARYAPANWTLEFVRVAGDSRCPKNALCVWAGDAELELRAYRDRDQKRFSLHTNLEPREAVVLGYRLKLVGLEPEKESGVAPAYRASFTLEQP